LSRQAVAIGARYNCSSRAAAANGGAMLKTRMTGQRLVALFLLGCVLFNYPVLYLFNSPRALFGIPLLYFYIFAAWAALIAFMAYVIERATPAGLTRKPEE
jgi:hypothetical protein